MSLWVPGFLSLLRLKNPGTQSDIHYYFCMLISAYQSSCYSVRSDKDICYMTASKVLIPLAETAYNSVVLKFLLNRMADNHALMFFFIAVGHGRPLI